MINFIADSEIRLKELQLEDAGTIFHTIDSQRAYLGEWLPFVELTTELSFTKNYISSYLSNEDRDLTCTIWYKNRFAGLIGLKDTDYDNKKTEIGYWLSNEFQSKGIATRSSKKIIEYAFGKLQLNRIQIRVATENIKSRAIPERLGFVLEGIERDGELHSRGFMNLAVYSLLRKEWLEQREIHHP